MPNIYFEKLNPNVCDVSVPPSPASRSEQPEWWKDIPRYRDLETGHVLNNFEHRERATIRNCPAVNDSMFFGYTVYISYDLWIDATGQEVRWVSSKVDTSLIGANEQGNLVMGTDLGMMGTFKVPDGFHPMPLRWNSMWGIRTEEGYSTWITHPINRFDLPFMAMDGIIDTDKFPARFPYNFFVKKGFRGTIKAGTPMIQAIPFKRENFDSHIVDIDYGDVYNKNELLGSRFSNVYKKLFWTRKKFN